MGTGLDLDAMVFAAGQIVPVLRTLHEMRFPFGLDRGRVSPLPLLPQKLCVFPGEIFVFVPAWFVLFHRLETPCFDCS